MATFACQVDYTHISCGECGTKFAITKALDSALTSKGGDIWCPRGHLLTYGEGEKSKLKRQLANKQAALDGVKRDLDDERDRHAHTEARRRAAKGQLTKTKKRIANGVCPCCNRTFKDLAAHMTTKHPDYATKE